MLKPHSKWITLRRPIEREGQEPIKAVRLRRPIASDVIAAGNHGIADILRMKADAMVAVIPRIAEPFLVKDEVANMDVGDLLALSSEIVGFIVDPQEAEEIVADAAED